MRNTPQRLRSYAPPTRDKIFIWSAVVAGCGIMALLGRHAAIHRFGSDQFTDNVLFAVFFVLSIGLYCGFQSVIEDVFNRFQSLFRRREVMAIAETTTGELYSEEHDYKFPVERVTVQITPGPTDKRKLQLNIDKVPFKEWCREKFEKLRHILRPQTTNRYKL
ncbi:hypothetical protein [Bacteroides acidifaciens]|mgnify:CR=1 FL=1|uniref:hypothetical protein n=1 Tax=Bacteroides acidifaciens TaxID=85831 RepID=UPI002596AF02|nr:hypothetical protein [Bacteroides acidifaciens]